MRIKKNIRHPSNNILNAKRISRLYCSNPPEPIDTMLLFLQKNTTSAKLYYISASFLLFLVFNILKMLQFFYILIKQGADINRISTPFPRHPHSQEQIIPNRI